MFTGTAVSGELFRKQILRTTHIITLFYVLFYFLKMEDIFQNVNGSLSLIACA